MKSLLSPVSSDKAHWPKVWLAAGGLAVVVALGWSAKQPWFPFTIATKQSSTAGTETPKPASQFTAIYLDNDQVFYGRSQGTRGPYLVLTDAYYYQPGSRSSKEGTIRIVKVGTELHQPKDTVMLNSTHIIMQEPLSADSKVVKAIEKYQSEQGGSR